MNRYKILRVDETEIEIFESFLNKSAEQGWHPMNHWTRYFGILKFSNDLIKKPNYTVLFNQAKTGAQLKLSKSQTKGESDEKFKAFLEEFNVEHVMKYSSFDILYTESEVDVFTDREFQNDIIKNFIKKISVSFLLLVVLYAITLYFLIYNLNFVGFLSSSNLITIIIYSEVLIIFCIKYFKGYRYKKGKITDSKMKWKTTKSDALTLLYFIYNILIVSALIFNTVELTKKFNILLIPIGFFLIIFSVYIFDKIDNSKSTNESKNINKVLTIFLAVILFFISGTFSNNQKFSFIYSNSPFDLSLTECNQSPNVDTSHSFFIQAYSVSCDEEYVSLFKIKSPIYKSYFRDGAMGELGIDEYTLNNMNEGELTVINGKTIPVYIYVKEDFIIYTISQDNQLFFKLINNLE